MKRTIKEIYEIIVDKRRNARDHYSRIRKESELPNDKTLFQTLYDHAMMDNLSGEIDAYTDVLCLIESSGDLNED